MKYHEKPHYGPILGSHKKPMNFGELEGLECRSVPMYQDGMDLDRLEENGMGSGHG